MWCILFRRPCKREAPTHSGDCLKESDHIHLLLSHWLQEPLKKNLKKKMGSFSATSPLVVLEIQHNISLWLMHLSIYHVTITITSPWNSKLVSFMQEPYSVLKTVWKDCSICLCRPLSRFLAFWAKFDLILFQKEPKEALKIKIGKRMIYEKKMPLKNDGFLYQNSILTD